jgi:hypothetical protein
VRGIVATEGWSEAGMEAGRKNGHASIRLTILRVDKQQAAHEWGARQHLTWSAAIRAEDKAAVKA